MRKTFLFTVIAFVIMSFVNDSKQKDNTLTKKEKKEGWVLLFDGTTIVITTAVVINSAIMPINDNDWYNTY